MKHLNLKDLSFDIIPICNNDWIANSVREYEEDQKARGDITQNWPLGDEGDTKNRHQGRDENGEVSIANPTDDDIGRKQQYERENVEAANDEHCACRRDRLYLCKVDNGRRNKALEKPIGKNKYKGKQQIILL